MAYLFSAQYAHGQLFVRGVPRYSRFPCCIPAVEKNTKTFYFGDCEKARHAIGTGIITNPKLERPGFLCGRPFLALLTPELGSLPRAVSRLLDIGQTLLTAPSYMCGSRRHRHSRLICWLRRHSMVVISLHCGIQGKKSVRKSPIHA